MTKNILIVEDDSQLQVIYQKKLKLVGYTTFSAITVRDAETILSNNQIDLILLDVMLPGGQNGFDLLEQIKQDDKYKNIPILVMTNLDSEEMTAKAIGANDYIVKASTNIDDVITKIKSYLPL